MTLLWCVTRGCFEPLSQYRKSQLERAYTEEWESSVLLRASCTTRPTALQGSALKIQADPVTDSHVGQCWYISPDLTWVFLGLFSRITSDSPVSPPFPPLTRTLESFQISWHNWHFQQHHALPGYSGQKHFCKCCETWPASLALHQGSAQPEILSLPLWQGTGNTLPLNFRV